MLSMAELKAIFPLSKGEILANNVFLLNIEEPIEPQKLIRRLGGTIKFGVVGDEIRDFKKLAILERIKKIITPTLKDASSKFNFGFSDYVNSGRINFNELGMETKKYLKSQNINCRWVISREKILSSVVVEQNKLISSGAEIIFFAKSKQILIGRTLAVQAFKELSYRDYGRPTRDDLSGMLPPKLAQIMLNLAQAPPDGLILDPFCGSGTILTEALLMGYRDLIGSDISEKAVIDTKNNIKWIQEKFVAANDNHENENDEIKNTKTKINIFKLSATELSQKIAAESVDAIITEPYLGPQRGQIEIGQVISELEKLYSDSIQEFKKILKPNGKIVMIWPMFAGYQGGKKSYIKIKPDIFGFKKNSESLIYGREGQRVWREIVILS